MNVAKLNGRELDEACARAMGWKRDGSKWRRPGVHTCASGGAAVSLTHERAHRKQVLPKFSADSAWLAMQLLWLRDRDGFDLTADFVEYSRPMFRVRWPAGQGDTTEIVGETPTLAAARAVVQVAEWQAAGGGRDD